MVELNLTKRQREIFDYIKKYSSEHGYPPTVRDIGKAIGLTSSSTVHAHLSNLEKLGLLRRDPTKPRALELLGEAARKVVGPSGLPLVGRVAAGSPILAEENIEDTLTLDTRVVRDGDFALRVRGDSMRDAGIFAGDYVVVHQQPVAHPGDIVVALVGDEATVKRFFPEDGRIRLQPEHPNMAAIYVHPDDATFRIVGKVAAVFRML